MRICLMNGRSSLMKIIWLAGIMHGKTGKEDLRTSRQAWCLPGEPEWDVYLQRNLRRKAETLGLDPEVSLDGVSWVGPKRSFAVSGARGVGGFPRRLGADRDLLPLRLGLAGLGAGREAGAAQCDAGGKDEMLHRDSWKRQPGCDPGRGAWVPGIFARRALSPLTPADGGGRAGCAGGRAQPGCRSAWWRASRDPAASAAHAGRRRD